MSKESFESYFTTNQVTGTSESNVVETFSNNEPSIQHSLFLLHEAKMQN